MKVSQDRPLATIAVIAFNQEQYIEEAVRGAFDQEYQPLEIILSDDCSTDRTFEIMQDLAASYDGDAQVVVNRNERNLGVGGHVRQIARMAKGEIIILAAGDDISLPYRTSVIAREFHDDSQVFAVFSASLDIDTKGAVVRVSDEMMVFNSSLYGLARRGGGIGSGATYAYRREVFFWPEEFPPDTVSEDRLLPFRARFLGRIVHITTPLVRRRNTGNSVSSSESYRPAQIRPDHIRHLKNTIEYAWSDGRINGQMKRRLIRIVDRSAAMRRAAIRYQSSTGMLSNLVYKIIDNVILWDTAHHRLYRLIVKIVAR